MRKTFDKMVLGMSAFALAFLGTAGKDADAATASSTGASETYSTTSDLSGVVGYNPITSASFGLNSNVSLGEFTVSTLADGETKTFKDTPFSIKYTPHGVGSSQFGITDAVFNGSLTGTISGDQSDLTATFKTDSSPVFHSLDGKYTSTISVLNDPLGLVPSSTGGRTTIQARVTTVALDPSDPVPSGTGINTPEPTTFAILATSLVGLGLRHRLRSARKPA